MQLITYEKPKRVFYKICVSLCNITKVKILPLCQNRQNELFRPFLKTSLVYSKKIQVLTCSAPMPQSRTSPTAKRWSPLLRFPSCNQRQCKLEIDNLFRLYGLGHLYKIIHCRDSYHRNYEFGNCSQFK